MIELRRAPSTGITGQDGFYLAEFQLEPGYDVHARMWRKRER